MLPSLQFSLPIDNLTLTARNRYGMDHQEFNPNFGRRYMHGLSLDVVTLGRQIKAERARFRESCTAAEVANEVQAYLARLDALPASSRRPQDIAVGLDIRRGFAAACAERTDPASDAGVAIRSLAAVLSTAVDALADSTDTSDSAVVHALGLVQAELAYSFHA